MEGYLRVEKTKMTGLTSRGGGAGGKAQGRLRHFGQSMAGRSAQGIAGVGFCLCGKESWRQVRGRDSGGSGEGPAGGWVVGLNQTE